MNLDRIIAVRNNKTVFRDGDRVIKVFDNDFTKADVLNEALNQALVEETGLHIPAILEVSRIDGRWAIVSEYIKGKNLAQLIADDSGKWLDVMAALHCEVASKSVPALPEKYAPRCSRQRRAMISTTGLTQCRSTRLCVTGISPRRTSRSRRTVRLISLTGHTHRAAIRHPTRQ